MPCLSSSYDPGVGLLTNLAVVQTGALTPQITLFPALMDTGASSTCISAQVAQTLKLQPTGKQSMVSATHAVPVNAYLVDLLFPFGNIAHVQSGVTVLEFVPMLNSPFQILIGRDVICRGSLTVSFDGHFTFCL